MAPLYVTSLSDPHHFHFVHNILSMRLFTTAAAILLLSRVQSGGAAEPKLRANMMKALEESESKKTTLRPSSSEQFAAVTDGFRPSSDQKTNSLETMVSNNKAAGRVLLPSTINPIRYDVKLTPDLQNYTFSGVTTIELSTTADVNTSDIVMQ
jgi:hypothetical protein